MLHKILIHILITSLIFSYLPVDNENNVSGCAIRALCSRLTEISDFSNTVSNKPVIENKTSLIAGYSIIFFMVFLIIFIVPSLSNSKKYADFQNFISPNVEVVTYDPNILKDDIISSIRDYYENMNIDEEINSISDLTAVISKLFANSVVYSNTYGEITKILIYPDNNMAEIRNAKTEECFSELDVLVKEYKDVVNSKTAKGWKQCIGILRKISDISPQTVFQILEDAPMSPWEDGSINIFSFPDHEIKNNLVKLINNLSDYDKERFFSLVEKNPSYTGTVGSNIVDISHCNLDLALEFVGKSKEDDIDDMFYSIMYKNVNMDYEYPKALVERLVIEKGEEWVNTHQDKALRDMINDITDGKNGRLERMVKALNIFKNTNISDHNLSLHQYYSSLATHLSDIGTTYFDLIKQLSLLSDITIEERTRLTEYQEQMQERYEEMFDLLSDIDRTYQVTGLAKYYMRQGYFDKVEYIYQTAVDRDIYVYDDKHNDMPLWFSKMYYEFWQETNDNDDRIYAQYFFDMMEKEYGIYDFDMDKFFSLLKEWGYFEWEKVIAIAKGEAVVEFEIDSETGSSVSDYNKKASSLLGGSLIKISLNSDKIDSETGSSVSDYNKKASSLLGGSLIKISLNSDKKEGLPVIKLPQKFIEYENYAINKMEPSLIPFLKSNFNAVFSALFLLLVGFSAIIGWFVSKVVYKNYRLETKFDVLGDTEKKIARKQTFLNTLKDRLAKEGTVAKWQNQNHSFTLFRTATESERRRILIENRSFPFIAFNGQDAKKAVSQQYSDFPKAVPEFECIGHKISKEVLAVYSSC